MTNTISESKTRVSFKSQGCTLVGDLHLPAGFDSSKTYPTVIYSGPFNQVKEQTGDIYGRKLAALGFVVLNFDHIGYGESEGEIRNYENGYVKMESIRDGISYLRTQAFVDRDRLYGLGICASGGYMALVASTDKRMKAIASVCGMMDNKASFFGIMSREQIVPLLAAANEARQNAYESGQFDYIDALGMESLNLDELQDDDPQKEGYDFYMTARAGKETYPNYTHKAPGNLMEISPMTSAVDYAPYLYTPYLGIYGEKAATNTGALTVAFHQKCSEPKELFEVPGASHVSLYDIDKDVDRAVAKLAEFFGKY